MAVFAKTGQVIAVINNGYVVFRLKSKGSGKDDPKALWQKCDERAMPIWWRKNSLALFPTLKSPNNTSIMNLYFPYIYIQVFIKFETATKKIPNETWFLPAVFHCFGQRRFRLQNNFVYLFVQLKSMWQKENINTKYNYNIYCLNIAIPGGRAKTIRTPNKPVIMDRAN